MDTCGDCGKEMDMRLLEHFSHSGTLDFGPTEKWLCHACHINAVADLDNYWSDIGEDR